MSKTKKARKPRYESPHHAHIGRLMTLVGYFGLLLLIINWFSWIAPPEQVPRSLTIAGLAIPLLFPLRGIIHARRYTHQWVGFLSMLYFIIGVDVWFNQQAIEQLLGMSMVLFSLLLMVGSSMYSRYTPTPPELRKPVEDK
ncbi:DUF2069 domain-containing protein [Granulosicoccus antarcticus]|uniref:DUF2069 domain-containing protein n=1 Tax=Granulosicoccus antarcticus IMCC3135 TaxID=1192854 RepID=A0A2Z2P1K3_9GAMM|nr:DUF2069 domain-containing protein [Granulosicoccus antarcticus]ASJ76088.1 hypothetical protein IMCC3135_30195 [Granulosicoccus antarcticus IMCC3135]